MVEITTGLGARDSAPPVALKDIITLLKPRVMSLVVFTGLVGLLLAPGQLHPVLAAVAVLCIAVGAGAAAAINMWYDRDIDAVMARTRNRPIPQGRVQPEVALGLGVSLGIGSVVLMGLAVNYLAAGLLALTILFYVFVYTMWLKRRTPQNIVIGGASGAFPPMIGWAAVTGQLEWTAIILFAIIFLWTPPHFWALALYRRGDYDRAGVPMMPVVAGEKSTRIQMFIYTLVLIPVTLLPCVVGEVGLVYGLGAAALGALFFVCAVTVLRSSDVKHARRMFSFSILYLFLLFGLLLVDKGWHLPI